MSRYIKEFQMDQPIDVVSIVMEDFVYHNKFRRTDWNGEMVYNSSESGTDIYFKWSYAGGLFHMEAWIRGLAGKEMDLDGVYKSGERAAFKMKLEILECNLKTHCGHVEAGGIGFDPTNHTNDVHIDIGEDEPYEESVGYNYSYKDKLPNMPDQRQISAFTMALIGLIFGASTGIGIILGLIALARIKGCEKNNFTKVIILISVISVISGIAAAVTVFSNPEIREMFSNFMQNMEILRNGIE